MTTVADYQVSRADVRNVTLAEWLHLIEETTLHDGYRLSIGIFDENDFLLLDIVDKRLKVTMSAQAPRWNSTSVEAILRTMVEAKGDRLSSLSEYDESGDGYWNFYILCTADDRTIDHIFDFQEACGQVLKLPEHPVAVGASGADAAYQILLAGGAEPLLGLPESSWLEVKSRQYDLDSFAGQIELAQDAARFANGTEPAILVLGFRTTKKNGVDTLVRVTPLNLTVNAVARYREVLDRRIYPQIEGLVVTRVEVRGGALLIIGIPRQPDSARPFLVHGVVVDGRNEGAFVSIIQRRDEVSKPMTVAEIHALMPAGRSILRGERRP
ncbi:AlbA family DNA-binding domain-containing protein [Phytohabitans suffuscus]|uniref:Schlafen AlbA-2 domain-containing protein n=1 Tax=Phytohabitans suffuscus TaxID=624315 RepID=A0A6F8YHB1_9ACTN|nr:hypothetical protein [Phytohabitans suffuscus]BCB85515.1 hypothetical protein Psuf_028280 [Phytohabitans suffuscus]